MFDLFSCLFGIGPRLLLSMTRRLENRLPLLLRGELLSVVLAHANTTYMSRKMVEHSVIELESSSDE